MVSWLVVFSAWHNQESPGKKEPHLRNCQVKLTCGHAISMENSLDYWLVWEGSVYWEGWFPWATALELYVKRGWAWVRRDKAVSSILPWFLLQILPESLPLTPFNDGLSSGIRSQITLFFPYITFVCVYPYNRKATREEGWYPALCPALFGWMPFGIHFVFWKTFSSKCYILVFLDLAPSNWDRVLSMTHPRQRH